MRRNTFTSRIAPHVNAELTLARTARADGRFAEEFAHLEAAHVIGQQSTRWHVLTHIEMARWASRQHDARELLGQMLRIVGAATKTFIGLIPHGNTGGTNISPLARLPLCPSHEALINDARADT